MWTSLPQHDRDLPARRRGLALRREEYAFTTFRGLPIGQAFHQRDRAGLGWVREMLALIYRSRRNLEGYLAVSGRAFSKPLPRHSAAELALALLRKDFTTLLNHYLPDLGPAGDGGRASSLGEYRQIFQREPLPRIADLFMEDWVFARSFVAGPNPVLLRRLSHPPAHFPLGDDELRQVSGFGDDSLHRAVGEGRTYLVDYATLGLLRPGVHPQQRKHLYQPRVLLALPRGRPSLVAVAISGGPSPDAPVYTPAHGWSWQVAKQTVRVADGCHQELLTHLGFTHLVIEAFVVATRRCLAEAHPLHRLLEPHFEGTMPINALAVKKLIQPGEAVDRLVAADVPSIYELLKRERLAFSFLRPPAAGRSGGPRGRRRQPATGLSLPRRRPGHLAGHQPLDVGLLGEIGGGVAGWRWSQNGICQREQERAVKGKSMQPVEVRPKEVSVHLGRPQPMNSE